MRRLTLTVLVALGTAGALSALPHGVEARPGSDPEGPLVVTAVTPARGQETLPDLSDPGLNNRITVKFSANPNPADLLDEENLVNGLSDKCELLDQAFRRIPGSATVTRNVLTINPFSVVSPVLPQGRYSLTLERTIRSTRGKPLNGGRADFTLVFSVGSDVFPPVLRRMTPSQGEDGVSLRRSIVATFDTPMNPATAKDSIRLEDRSTDPPTRIRSRVRVMRGGLDVVVTPTRRGGYPAGALVAMVVSGRGTSTDGTARLLTDRHGNEFTRDAGVQWHADAGEPTLFHSLNGDFDDVTGLFTLTFRTKGGAAAR